MALDVERLNPFRRKEPLSEVKTTFEATPEMEGMGIKNVENDFPATAKDAQGPQGQPLIQTPQTQPITIQINAGSLEELEMAKKASADAEETGPWNIRALIRAVKIAFHRGKQVIFGPPKVNQPI